MKIAVIFPSRGLAFSQTCQELLENLEGYKYDIFFSHGLPIPECFNRPLEEALEGSYSHYWFVEDDMIIPKNTLKKLLAEKVPAVACDYPLSREGKPSIYRDPDGNAIYGGTGCLLATRSFLKGYKPPVFRTDIAWDVHHGQTLEMTPRRINGNAYGLHDITFSLLAPKPIKVSKIKCGQRKLRALGQLGTNLGMHDIETWTVIKPETFKGGKEENRNVVLSDGTITFMDLKRAKALEKTGKLTIPPFKYVELVNNEVLESIR